MARYRRQVVGGLRAADCVVAPTRAVQDDLRRQYGLPLWNARIIPNGIDSSAFMPRPKRPVIMAAGRIWDAAKNLRLLDDIAPRLDWPIEIAGEAAHPEQGVAGLRHARLLGVLHPEEMRRHLAEAAIFAAPALYEPFGLTVLEAAAAGCALVLGDIASLRENWEGAAIFLPSEDARAVAGRPHPPDRRSRANASGLPPRPVARAKRFTLANTAPRYRALYCELTGARSSASSQRAGGVMAKIVLFCHSLRSDWNHGNAHFLRGIATELQRAGLTFRPSSPKTAGAPSIS